jgi:glucokinase
MQEKYSIGIDIGGTNTDIGLVNSEGKIVARTNFSTAEHSNFDIYIATIAQKIKELLNQNSIDEIEGVGVGAPNGNYYTGCIDNAPNLHFGGNLHVKEELERALSVPVVLSNDANAAAYGEFVYGGGKGMKDFLMVTVGTGVGSGFVVDGKLVHGYTGAAGELGHSILIPEGRACSCGRKGCLEAYTSARGICQTFVELRDNTPQYNGTLSTVAKEQITSQMIGEAAKNGDELALLTFEKTGYWLGLACANAVTFSSPEAIFLMGGPLKAGDVFLKPLEKSFRENLLNIYQGKVDIRMSELNANDVAILGAAALLKNEK